MKKQVFSVYDSKAEVFHQPMFLNTIGEATRNFEDACRQEDSPMASHPEDYTLFHIGEFDSDKGLLTPLTTPASLGLAIEYLREDS